MNLAQPVPPTEAPAAIAYRRDPRPGLEAIRNLYAAAPLRRPIGDPATIQAMFDHANLVLSAWDGTRLVGLLRGWTDFVFDGYICDLAVHPGYHRQGIGRELLDRAQALGPNIGWVLLASPLAKDYYGGLGWEAIGNGWRRARRDAMPTYEEYQDAFGDLADRA
jgi:GNAT superfamily N-acetyltransferase